MDHDRLFKQLLTTFFVEFIELFLRELSTHLQRDSIEFLDKEVFTDLTGGERHEVDLLARARLEDTDAFFLIHVENQATRQPEFGQRMFRYFARLHEKFGLPVYPIALLSYDTPRSPERDHYEVKSRIGGCCRSGTG
jgi:predicted transposase/invertase (TIGR01784 family)